MWGESGVTRIHLDTDIGGDTDDLCALAMLLGWPGADLVGVTTSSDREGLRAGCAGYALRLAGRGEVPVAAGADGSFGGYYMEAGFPDLARYWPGSVRARPSQPGAALDLLARSMEAGAVVAVVGPWTNLALLEVMRPGLLSGARVVAVGGYVRPPGEGLPAWGPEMDYNVQQDALAARLVWERCDPVLVPLDVCLGVTLRSSHLPTLREGGELSRLVALQSELHGAENDMARMGAEHERLPNDLLNFHYDPLACAAALGWDGATVEELQLEARLEGGVLAFPESASGKRTRVVTGVDAARFEREWLEAVAR